MYIIQLLDQLAGGGAETVGFNLSRGLSLVGVKNELIVFHGFSTDCRTVCADDITISSVSLSGQCVLDDGVAYLDQKIRELSLEHERIGIICHLEFSEQVVHQLNSKIASLCSIKIVIHTPISRTRAELFKGLSLRQRLAFWRCIKIQKKIQTKRNRTLSNFKKFGVICVGEHVYKDFLLYAKSIDKCSYVRNPVSIEFVRQKSEGSKLYHGVYFVHVARFCRQKQHLDLLKAYLLSQVATPLLLLGDGPMRPVVEKFISRHKLTDKVKILGFVDNPYPYLGNARALLLTSKFEGYPMCILESLALGTPVLSYDCPTGPSELLGKESPQSLIRLGDINEFALRLREIESGLLRLPIPDISQNNSKFVAEQYLDILFSRSRHEN